MLIFFWGKKTPDQSNKKTGNNGLVFSYFYSFNYHKYRKKRSKYQEGSEILFWRKTKLGAINNNF